VETGTLLDLGKGYELLLIGLGEDAWQRFAAQVEFL
jgi:hypothetical protein